MRKGIKILGKVFSAAVLLLIIVPVALSLLLDIPAVQNYAVHRAARFVSRKLETTVSIDRVDIGIFSKVRVKGFYVEDYQRDTLLYVGKLDAFITSFGIFGGGLELSRGEIADARLYLRQTPGGEMNIKQIVDRISDPDKPKKGNFRLSLKKASIENMDLCLERLDHRDPEHGIDFSHMHLYGITARVDDFTIDGQAIYTSIAAFSARERSGFVLGEGAAILLLEELEHAKARGARILAEVVGYGATCDAYHMTAPRPDGSGAAKAMEMALADGGAKPEDVDYINAHGTSTPLNDAGETAAVKTVFGDHAYKLAISSTKSMTGHMLGAAGAVEAMFCAMALHDGYLPATINYQVPDPACDLDVVPGHGRSADVRYAMSNSLGFGGHNGSLLFKRWEA